MTPEQLFTILDDFEERTRQSNLDSLQNLENKLGSSALTGFNFNYSWSGDTAAALDPYFSFKYSLRRWVESFGRLNIEYSEAELTLDLLDRKGKYQNGFCHGPMPSHFNDESWVPAKVNFTSNAKPDQVGSGYSGINTLFHEGGHAAHFANVKQNSPCFAQEFAPTSMAYAETQSMFCDSLLEDADWLKTYALNEDGESVPNELIKETIFARQPFMAYQERSILVVPYFEWALYSLEDEALTPENITELARSKEKSILGLACSPRPLLAIPHLLSQESACSYQGYLLAHMAVYQTRAYFENKFGYLTDNAKIGPLLAEYYWKQGNAIDHNQTLVDLTGEGFNAEYLARECSLTSEQAWEYALNQINSSNTRTQVEPNKLNAKVRIVDGAFEICNNQISDNDMCDKFEAYITQHYS
jgi:oligoendopeptidase F